MLYSLSRWRHFRPIPPFELGGELLVFGGRYLLCNEGITLELKSKQNNLQGLSSGDLIQVQVSGIENDGALANVDSVELIHKCTLEKSSWAGKTQASHADRFPAFVADLRDILLDRGLKEIFTPTLVRCPGLEPSLKPFDTELAWGSRKERVFLPTSPEIHLKKALISGMTDIFEIKNVFRGDEFTSHHEPEFLMLEWYRAYANLRLIREDLKEIVLALEKRGWARTPIAEFSVRSCASLFQEFLGFDLKPDTCREQVLELAEKHGVEVSGGDSFNDMYHRLWIAKIEDRLSELGPLIVENYPPSQAALAKLNLEGWADRIEFYWNGLEIANAFNEVTEPEEQLKRWENEQMERRHLGTGELPLDQKLIDGMKVGLPPTGGIALGVERLYMALMGIEEIRELRLFSARDLFLV